MPIDLNRYPPYWKQFSYWVRFTRAHGRCECNGQCGLHGGQEKPRRCTEVHGRVANFARGKVILTTAHLCECDPPCSKQHHVIAACQRCHLRIDAALHVRHKRERGTLYTPEWVRAAHTRLRDLYLADRQ
jgi:hypothetical protein